MNEQCAQCGQPLATGTSICTACDDELGRAPGSAPASECKYVCPACRQGISVAETVNWPPVLPWWKPQKQRLRCPSCKVFLRRQSDTPMLRRVLLLLWLPAFMHLIIGTPNVFFLLFYYSVFAALITGLAVKVCRALRDGDPYVIDNEA